MKHFVLIAVLFIAACLIAVPASATIVCDPAGGTYANTTYITCSYVPYDLGSGTANASMRFYYMAGGHEGPVRKDVSNPIDARPFHGGNTTGLFYPPPYNLSDTYYIIVTYGDGTHSNTITQPLNSTLVGSGASNGWVGYFYGPSYKFNNYLPLAPMANFTATPTSGSVPLSVSFTDTSTNATAPYNWSVSPAPGVSIDSPSSANTLMHFPAVGNYTITHGVYGIDGSSDIETKNEYIYVYNSTATITTGFRAKDGTTGNIIIDAAISMQDIENNSWKNGTAVRGTASISVLTGHHINAYATATGYGDADTLALLASPYTYDITMLPTGFANVSAGNVTAYITVKDYDTLQTMQGVQVTAGYANNLGDAIYLDAVTNGAGVAAFVLPNKTNVHFAAQKVGYGGASIVLNTGTASGGDAKVVGEIKLSKNWVTPTITGTLLPDGSTPTATQTILPGCEDPNSVTCRNAHSNQGLNYLGENMMMLIELCVLVTICYLLGVKL